MWKISGLTYLAIGLCIALLPGPRAATRRSFARVVLGGNPRWRVAGFKTTAYSAAVALWPLFLRSWFSKPESVWDALQENPLFQEQKALFDAICVLCSEGVDANELPNGRGEFGLSATNPVPCKTVFGSTAYLGRLRASDGTKVAYKRIGSVQSDVSPSPIDAYEVMHRDGRKLATLYISPYHQRISERAPKGFTLSEHSFA